MHSNSDALMLLQILITIGASQVLTLAFLIWLKKERNQADYLLSLELLLMFLVIIFYNYHDELALFSPAWTFASFWFAYLALPTFYLYIRSASKGTIDFYNWKNWLPFVPFTLVMALFWQNYLQFDAVEQQAITAQIMSLSPPIWYKLVYYGIFFLVFPLYLLASMRLLQEHEHYILTKFSYKENVSLAWLNRFLWGEGFVWLGFLLFEVVGHHFLNIFGHDHGFQAAFIILIASIIYLGVYGLRYQGVFVDRNASPEPDIARKEVVVEKEETARYQSSSLQEERAIAYAKSIKTYMEQERPYLEPRITIGELASRMNIPVNHLSQVINEQFEQNFFDFVNTYRVRAFQQLVQERDLQSFTLLALAYEAGFNSKSSFNAIFKKIADMTPSEYVRSLRKLPSTKMSTNS
ncbi:MAG: helix-turn-helix domain-containing protein [Saprospiraceae bacterium]|nr:helix-turn-helix domain-containing protein [Saprospiraceae bacterium]